MLTAEVNNRVETHTDETIPEGAWAFDADVAAVFDDMLARSIPQYRVMREACLSVAAPFVRPGETVVDLGCSRGEALAPFIGRFGAANRFLGVEVSEPMRAAATQRFAGLENVKVIDCDLRRDFPLAKAGVVLSVLTLQFTPIEYRQRIVADVYDRLNPGGAFVLVEKILGAGAKIDALMVETYLGMKRANGYTQEQIDRKRLSLEGVLVPMTARWNEELLRDAGFTPVDCFWRWMNFAGWLAIKPRV